MLWGGGGGDSRFGLFMHKLVANGECVDAWVELKGSVVGGEEMTYCTNI